MGGRGCEGVGARAWVRGRGWECRARASTRLAQQVHGGERKVGVECRREARVNFPNHFKVMLCIYRTIFGRKISNMTVAC